MAENDQLNLLKGLLEQYSPTLQESPGVEFLAEQMRVLGFSVQVDEAGSVRGSLGDGPREILLLGHIDTVPGVVPVRLEDGRMYGRGAVDAKGPLACFTTAAAQAGAFSGWRVTVIGAVGEEGDSRGAKLVRDEYTAGRPPDFCVIGEPSGWDHLTLGYKGSAWMEYTFNRPLTHTASQADSACETAVQFWNAVQTLRDQINQGRQRAFEQLTTSLRHMDSSLDGFTDQARLEFNLRLPPEIDAEAAFSLLQPLAGTGQLRLIDGIACFRAEKNTALVRALLSAIREEDGKPGFLVKTGTSDMNLVGPAWNCPILAYGPGDSSLDHTPDEHILISEYRAGIRVLSQALRTLQQTEKTS